MKMQSVLAILCLVVFALYATLVGKYEGITQAQAGYATLIVLLGALPGVICLFDQREASLVPLMPLHGLFYALTFGLPVFSDKTQWLISDSNVITEALGLTVFGLICLYLGFYAFRGAFSKIRPIHFLGDIPPRRQIVIAWILFGIYLFLELIPGLKTFLSLSQLPTPLGYLSMGILFVHALDRNLSAPQLLLFAAAAGFTFISKLVGGSLATPVFLLVFWGIIYWHKRHTLPWHLIVISFAIAILLNPVKSDYREKVWYSEAPTESYIDKVISFYDSAVEHYAGDSIVSAVGEESSTINRLAHITLFSFVVGETPESVPYWLGGSYATLSTSFIPRLLWPDKPEGTIGQEFGHRYNLLNASDESTSLNLPWLPEFYANFGVVGVLGGMFVVGLLFRFLVQKFSVTIGRNIEYVLGIAITFALFYAETNLALMLGGVFLAYVAFVVLLRLLAVSASTRSA